MPILHSRPRPAAAPDPGAVRNWSVVVTPKLSLHYGVDPLAHAVRGINHSRHCYASADEDDHDGGDCNFGSSAHPFRSGCCALGSGVAPVSPLERRSI